MIYAINALLSRSYDTHCKHLYQQSCRVQRFIRISIIHTVSVDNKSRSGKVIDYHLKHIANRALGCLCEACIIVKYVSLQHHRLWCSASNYRKEGRFARARGTHEGQHLSRVASTCQVVHNLQCNSRLYTAFCHRLGRAGPPSLTCLR